MSIQRRGDRWRVRLVAPDGKWVSKTFEKKTDAERWKRETLSAFDRDSFVDPRAGRITVAEYAARWIGSQPWRDSTRDRMQFIVDSRIVPKFGDWRLTAVRPSDVEAWVTEMSRERLKPSTVESYYRVLAALYRKALRDQLVVRTPCVDIALPRREKTSRSLVPITTDEVAAIVAHLPDHMKAVAWTQATLGLRTGEVTGLTVDRVNWLRRSVTIDRQMVTPQTGSPSFGPPKTEASARTLEMSVWLSERLAEHLRLHGEGEWGLLFHTTSGLPIRRAHWAETFKKAATAAGVSARPHDLRHYAASLLINRGVSVKAVQAFCGHATAQETLDTYGHLWPDDSGRIAQIFDGEFAGAAAPAGTTAAGH